MMKTQFGSKTKGLKTISDGPQPLETLPPPLVEFPVREGHVSHVGGSTWHHFLSCQNTERPVQLLIRPVGRSLSSAHQEDTQ